MFKVAAGIECENLESIWPSIEVIGATERLPRARIDRKRVANLRHGRAANCDERGRTSERER